MPKRHNPAEVKEPEEVSAPAGLDPNPAGQLYSRVREREHTVDYRPKTKPFDHQQRVWEQSRDLPAYALFWEQGTGKTKTAIDTLGWLWARGEVNGCVVVAPSGVHHNWVKHELTAHMPDEVPVTAHAFQTERADTKWHQQAVTDLVKSNQLAVLAISYDGWMTKRGKKAVWDMMRKRRCLLVLDEAHRVKTPTAKRTQSVLAGSKHAPYRRVLTGTPVTQGPFDVYTQVKALDPDFWKRELDLDSFTAFKSWFGVWEKKFNPRANDGKGLEWDDLVGYQNLHELKAALAKVGSRVVKEDVLDLPPKVYSRRFYRLTPAQERAYRELERDLMTFLETGEAVTAQLVIVKMLRMQQVLCGYVPVDVEEAADPSDRLRLLVEPRDNPRLRALMEAVEDTPGQAIVWAAWRKDIDMIMEALSAAGHRPVRHDGAVSESHREAAKAAFKAGDATHFVSNCSMCEGYTLTEAASVIYFNNTYRLVDRLQSEDRAHRIGQTRSVNYTDLVCPGTRDEAAIANLVAKRDVAGFLLGDERGDWL